jgi:hypothetical protein
LAYADWLAERGQNRLAAFIRAHCAQGDFLVAEPNADRRPLCLEVMQLQPQLRSGLLAPFRSLGESLLVVSPTEEKTLEVLQKKFSFWVDRGLVEEVEVYGAAALFALVRRLGEIVAQTPLRRLRVTPYLMRPPFGGPVNHWPGGVDGPVTLAPVEALLNAPEINRIESLDFRGLSFAGPLASRLLDRAGRLRLRRLCLNTNHIVYSTQNALRDRFGKVLHLTRDPINDDIPF